MVIEEDLVAHLTTTLSQENMDNVIMTMTMTLDIASWAEDWTSHPRAVNHMEKVLKASNKSRRQCLEAASWRHNLHLDRHQRLRCSGSNTSKLYQLSNPSLSWWWRRGGERGHQEAGESLSGALAQGTEKL